MGGQARRKSEKRRHSCRTRAHTIRAFHLPPMIRDVKATGHCVGTIIKGSTNKKFRTCKWLANGFLFPGCSERSSCLANIGGTDALKAICVTSSRALEVRDIPLLSEPAEGHVLVDMDSSAINPGDKTFLTRPLATGGYVPGSGYDVWGSSGAGKVLALGANVPSSYAGKQVAIYRSLQRSPDTIGLWSERAQVPYRSCLILPDDVSMRDYGGSLVNVITAYAFLQEIVAEGHSGIIVTAGSAATGRALASLARRRNMPAIFLVRSLAAQESLQRHGIEHVIVTADEKFESRLGGLAAELQTTAVFDGVGGDMTSRIAPNLPVNSTIYIYGLLGGAAPVSFPSTLFLTKNLIVKRFSNFESQTVKNPAKLTVALKELESLIDDPMFMTRIGREFAFDQISEAMNYEPRSGAKAILVSY